MDQVLVIANQEKFWYEPITFTPTDGQGIEYPYEDALVISTIMKGHRVHWILVDNDSSMNILSIEAMMKIGIDASTMTLVPTPLIGIEGSAVPVKGAVGLTVIMRSIPYCVTLQQTFMVIDTHLPYNAIIGRPLLHQLSVVVSIKYLALKFLTSKGITTVKGNQEVSRECANTCLKGKKALLIDRPETYEEKPKVRIEVVEELVKVCLGPREKEVTKVGCTLNSQQKQDLTELLVSHRGNFAFYPEDIPGISSEIASHRLSVNPSFPSVCQKKRSVRGASRRPLLKRLTSSWQQDSYGR